MWSWLKGIFQKKNKCDCTDCTCPFKCKSCVYWKSEAENNVPFAEEFSKEFANYPGEYRFCDIHKQYTHKIHSCDNYIVELFEAKPDSIQSEEIEINHELVVDGSQKNDTDGKN